jgi:hypothetical protein
MCQRNVINATEVNHGFGLEFLCIVCYNLSRVVEPSKDIGFQKVHNHLVSSIPGGCNLDPFGKLFSGIENPFMFPTGGWIYLTYKI